MSNDYDPSTAAKRAVIKNAEHGLSRHRQPELARLKVTSVLTEKAHTSALTQYAHWLLLHRDGKRLKHSTSADASCFLTHRSKTCRQTTLDLGRQAINMHLHPNEPLDYVGSEVRTEEKDRAYTEKEIVLLVKAANPDLALSITLAAIAGLRSMELITLCPSTSQAASSREWHPSRFEGREEYLPFVVHGKGGLVREVRIPAPLSIELGRRKRPAPLRVSHRGAHLRSHCTLISGHAFSLQFGRLSKTILGFSHGCHGLRHSFAQRRRIELMCCGHSHNDAVLILSQELGHFSVANTWAYLRDERG